MWGDDLVHSVWVGCCIKKATGVTLCRNMHFLDCYSLFGVSGRTGERLGEMMLERSD